MKLGCVAIAFNEERFMPKYIQAMQDRVDEILVLHSTKPWYGGADKRDRTGTIARSLGASVVEDAWLNETEQRNAGQEYFADCDWIIVLDPDEFMLNDTFDKLIAFLETAPLDAYVPRLQHTYWKTGYVIEPPEDYRQIIAVRPLVRFIDKRVVDTAWDYAPVDLHHMSWARTDEEVWRKINSYGHAQEFDTLRWFSEVWQSDQLHDLHPLTPNALRYATPVSLPEELERLNLWPSKELIDHKPVQTRAHHAI